MTSPLKGQVAIVTGGANGLARATAEAFGAAGVLVVVADVNTDGATAVAKGIDEAGGEALSVRCDVTSDEDFEDLKKAVLETFGHVDIVMNTVGALAFGPPHEIPMEEWRRIIDINLLAMVRSNNLFVPLLLEQGSGHIVNVSSTSGLWAYSYDRLPYAATKFAVCGITEALALYLRPRGVNVTLVCPGGMDGAENVSWARTYADFPRVRYNPPMTRRTVADVAQMIIDAIVSNKFFLPTPPEVPAILQQRAAHLDAFLEATIEGIQAAMGPV